MLNPHTSMIRESITDRIRNTRLIWLFQKPRKVITAKIPAIMRPATIPLRAEFMEEESCCWYAYANSITFFARMITPTAPIMASTSVFRLLMGFKTSDTPEAWTGRL